MNPSIPTDQARLTSFQQTLLSARRTMLLSETLKLAMDSFRASKMRFALTALGMVIGTASVILVITIGLTGQEFVLQELEKIETNAVELEYSGGGATDAERVLYSDSLTRDDEKAVLAQLPGVMYSSPVVGLHDRISYAGSWREPAVPAYPQSAGARRPFS
jgi:putative ABC transport system permease protein